MYKRKKILLNIKNKILYSTTKIYTPCSDPLLLFVLFCPKARAANVRYPWKHSKLALTYIFTSTMIIEFLNRNCRGLYLRQNGDTDLHICQVCD